VRVLLVRLSVCLSVGPSRTESNLENKKLQKSHNWYKGFPGRYNSCANLQF